MHALNNVMSEPSILVLIAFAQSDGEMTIPEIDGILRHGMSLLKDLDDREELAGMQPSHRLRIVRLLEAVRPAHVDIRHAIHEVCNRGPAATAGLALALRRIAWCDGAVSIQKDAFVKTISVWGPAFRGCLHDTRLHLG